jgi:hypothetical protein
MNHSPTHPGRDHAVTPAMVWVLIVIAMAFACAVGFAASLAAISL